MQLRLSDIPEKRAEQIRELERLFKVGPVPGHPDRVEVWWG